GAARRCRRADGAARHAGARDSQRGDRDRQTLWLRGFRPFRERSARSCGSRAETRRALMLHAIVSDIHGNFEALETVLADIARYRPATIQCLGDFVGYGASPNECIDRLRPMIEHAVVGNHDLAACGKLKLTYFNPNAAMAAQWTEAALTPENRKYLEEL